MCVYGDILLCLVGVVILFSYNLSRRYCRRLVLMLNM